MPKLHTFGEALAALKEGKEVYRQAWDGTTLQYIPATKDTFETIQVNLWNGKKVIGWVNTTEDLFADDWVIK